jgi:RimJ/RimL family protein N-acetyltransferase
LIIYTNADVIGPWVKGRGTGIACLNDVTGEIQTGVLFEDWNKANVICHIASENSRVKPAFMRVCFDYIFNQLKVKRVTSPISSSNLQAINFVKHLGFEHEATLIEAHPDGDILIFRMMRNQCKWLEPK